VDRPAIGRRRSTRTAAMASRFAARAGRGIARSHTRSARAVGATSLESSQSASLSAVRPPPGPDISSSRGHRAPCLASARTPARRQRAPRWQPTRACLAERSQFLACCSPLVWRSFGRQAVEQEVRRRANGRCRRRDALRRLECHASLRPDPPTDRRRSIAWYARSSRATLGSNRVVRTARAVRFLRRDYVAATRRPETRSRNARTRVGPAGRNC